jgi:acyl-CoA synthetase (AMP-forming)/AMP-acid ligase II
VSVVVPSIGDRVAEWARRQPDAPAAISGDTTLSYRDLDRAADRLAHGLIQRGVTAGAIIVHIGRNGVAHPLLMVAAARVGAVFASLNWRATAAELAAVLADCRPRVVVVDDEFAATARTAVDLAAIEATVVVLASAVPDELLGDGGGDSDGEPVDRPAPGPDATIVALTYTSGTTGDPKGVAISRAQLDAYLMRETPWTMYPGDVALIVSPVFHIAGWGWVGIALAAGAAVVLAPDARPSAIVSAIVAHGVTLTLMVPTLIQAVLDEPGTAAALDSLRMVTYGAAAITPELIARLRAEAPHAALAQGYGLSESSGTIAALDPADHAEGSTRLTSVGRALAGIEVAVFDPDTQQPVADGVLGEIRTRSGQNCSGYLNKPEASARLWHDGWLCTGDLGWADDGYLYLVDRLDEVINSAGEKVAPSEVERVIARVPGVAEVGVVGTAHPHWGQAVTAAIVTAPGATVNEADVVAACRAELAGYKCPRRVEWVAALPHTSSGKLSRRILRAELGEG